MHHVNRLSHFEFGILNYQFWIALALALTLSGKGLGQETPADKAPDQRGSVPRRSAPAGSPILKALDANRDRKIDAAEISKAPAALASLDKNKDGQITRDELQAARGEQRHEAPAATKTSRGGSRSAVLMAIDTNKDGTISTEEIAHSPAALKTLDKNKDGELTGDELRGDRPRGDRPKRQRQRQ